MDNGSELVSQALQQFCAGNVGLSYIPPGTPWNNGYIESDQNVYITRSAETVELWQRVEVVAELTCEPRWAFGAGVGNGNASVLSLNPPIDCGLGGEFRCVAAAGVRAWLSARPRCRVVPLGLSARGWFGVCC